MARLASNVMMTAVPGESTRSMSSVPSNSSRDGRGPCQLDGQCQHDHTLGHLCGPNPNKGDASMRVAPAGVRTVLPQSLVRAGTAGSVVASKGVALSPVARLL